MTKKLTVAKIIELYKGVLILLRKINKTNGIIKNKKLKMKLFASLCLAVTASAIGIQESKFDPFMQIDANL